MHRLFAECAVHIGRFRPPKTHRAAAYPDREDDPEPGIRLTQNLLAKGAAIRRPHLVCRQLACHGEAFKRSKFLLRRSEADIRECPRPRHSCLAATTDAVGAWHIEWRDSYTRSGALNHGMQYDPALKDTAIRPRAGESLATMVPAQWWSWKAEPRCDTRWRNSQFNPAF
jgi:hypothetical protein